MAIFPRSRVLLAGLALVPGLALASPGRDADCVEPRLTNAPRSVAAYVGEVVTLSAAASGPRLGYQWFRSDTFCPGKMVTGTPVKGATDRVLTVKANETAAYWVVVSNDCGEATSPIAMVSSPIADSSTCIVPASHNGALHLLSNRFDVRLFATDHRTGNTANGSPIPQNDLFGYFSIPGLTNNPSNPEVFVKVLDAGSGRFWVFYGGLTDFQYTVTVVDTFTGQRRDYSKPGGSACGGFDTSAFPTGGGTTTTTSSSFSTTTSSVSTTSRTTTSTTTTSTSGTAAMTFTLTDGCSDGRGIQYRFFDKTANLLWPNSSQVYIIPAGQTRSTSISCTRGNRICYGAQTDPPAGTYWGVGINGDLGCDTCCYTCADVTVSRNVTCN